MASHQPVRWPATPQPAVLLLGHFRTEDEAHAYCHLGPLIVSVEEDRYGTTFRVGVYPRRWSIATRLRVSGRADGEGR